MPTHDDSWRVASLADHRTRRRDDDVDHCSSFSPTAPDSENRWLLGRKYGSCGEVRRRRDCLSRRSSFGEEGRGSRTASLVRDHREQVEEIMRTDETCRCCVEDGVPVVVLRLAPGLVSRPRSAADPFGLLDVLEPVAFDPPLVLAPPEVGIILACTST